MSDRTLVPTAPVGDPLVAALERAMYDPSFDTAKFEVLIDRVVMLQMRDAERDFNDAIAAIQSELDVVTKDRANPHTRSRYATLDALYRESMPVCSKHGITVRFGSEQPPREGWLRITCKLSKGRFSEVHYLDGPIGGTSGVRGGATQMTPIQAVGSTVTYLRRYLLMMVLNLVQAEDGHDDDGNGGRDQLPPPQQQAPQVKPKTPDPQPGESLTDYSRRVEAARKGNGEPPPVESKPDLTVEEKRSQNWIRMVFQARCNAVQDKDAAGALLRDEELQAAEMRLKEKSPALWVEFDAVRQAMITRVWPPGEGEKTNGGAQ